MITPNEKKRIFKKTLKVIQSCQNEEQLETARIYAKKAYKYLGNKENSDINYEYKFMCMNLGIKPKSIMGM